MMKTVPAILIAWSPLISPAQTEAGPPQLFAKGIRMIARKVGFVGKEGAKAGLRKSVRHTASAAPTIVRKAGARVAASVARTTAKPTAAAGTTALSVVSRNLGAAGASAMARLSPGSARKVGEISALIAKSPHRAKWLSLIRAHGDDCAEFLWKHRKSVAVASVGTGMVLHPDAFTKMVGSGVESVGAHVVEPMITGASRDVVKPLVQSAVGTPAKAGLSVWGWSLFNGLLIGGFVWWRFRRN